jgi:hypothetical protein
MNAGSQRQALEQLRGLLANLVQAFELDDPERGLVGVVPVIGGTFLHPLTREPVARFKVYGAGADRVKIAEPRFLRSLPTTPVAGLTHPSQLCAGVAKSLSDFLSELGRLRSQTKARGLTLDLERDVLRLRGKAEIDEIPVEIVTRRPDQLVLVAVGEHPLYGKIPREERSLTLSADPSTDRESLAALVRSLDERARREALENVERKLGLDGQPPPRPEPAEEPPQQEELPTAPPAPPPSLDTQSFASVTSEVLELTETVETSGEVEAQPGGYQPPPAESPPVPTPPPEESLGAVDIKKLLDVLGNDAEVSAHGGRLRLVVPLKVVQGLYTFYLEQRGPTQFKGFLVSPQGTRHTVEFDLRQIEDIKQVFDRVVLGRQDFV